MTIQTVNRQDLSSARKRATTTQETRGLLALGLKTDAELHPDFDEAQAAASNAIVGTLMGYAIALGMALGWLLLCVLIAATINHFGRPQEKQRIVQSGFIEVTP